jgi:multicomponent Na+:H+ antiporter subunit D
MDFVCNFPFFTIVLCLFSAVTCIILNVKAARAFTLAIELLCAAMSAAVTLFCLQTEQPFIYPMGHFGAPWGNELRGGVLEGILGMTAAMVLFLSHLSGARYIERDIVNEKRNYYCVMLNLLGAAITFLLKLFNS